MTSLTIAGNGEVGESCVVYQDALVPVDEVEQLNQAWSCYEYIVYRIGPINAPRTLIAPEYRFEFNSPDTLQDISYIGDSVILNPVLLEKFLKALKRRTVRKLKKQMLKSKQ